jgi:thioredoxin 1
MEPETRSSAPEEPIQVSTESELDSAVESYDVVVADFYADWCGPCQMMEPAIETIAEETDAAVVKVDVDQLQQLAAQYRVQGVPTTLVFAGGDLAERQVGLLTAEQLATLVETHGA